MAILYHIRTDGAQVQHGEMGEKPLVVGRGECADAFVEDDALSRSHFLISREGADHLLIDLSSSNGTWVDGAPVSAHKLRPNELIHAGESLFYFSETPVTTSLIPGILPLIRGANATAARPPMS
jgi:pSer/pThr/pTyr-binding forkhead associated (FHA) protein